MSIGREVPSTDIRAGRELQSRTHLVILFPPGHAIHSHRFKFGEIEAEVLDNE
jgi:hypothetical protein